MLADAHRQAAEDIEADTQALQQAGSSGRLIIEAAWGAAFHWILFGCQTKFGQHQESHAHLGTSLRTRGATDVATWWEELDNRRQGGWYGRRTAPADVNAAIALLDQIRVWATTF